MKIGSNKKITATLGGSTDFSVENKSGFIDLLADPRGCFKRLSFPDFYILLNLYLIPNVMLGFINPRWFYTGVFDYQLFAFALTLPLLYFRGSRKFFALPGASFLILLCVFVVFQAFRSYVFLRIPAQEIISCMRYNIWSPLMGFCIIYAMSGRTREQLNNLTAIVIWLFVVQIFLASLSTFTTYDFFLSKRVKDIDFVLSLDGVRGNTTVYPKSVVLLTAVLVLVSCIRREQKWFWFSCMAVAMPLLYTMRSLTVRTIVSAFVAFSLFNVLIKQTFGRVVLVFSLLMVAWAVTPIIMPEYYDKVVHKFRLTDDIEEFISINNYQFRRDLIEQAQLSTQAAGNSLIGVGYQRDYDVTKREGYSYVLGSDAPLATILFCEGYLGVCLRIFPYVAFLAFAIGVLFKTARLYTRFMAIVVIATLAAEAVGWVQTHLLTQYVIYYVVLALLYFATIDDGGKTESQRKPKIGRGA